MHKIVASCLINVEKDRMVRVAQIQFNYLQMAGLIQGSSLPSMESDGVNDKREDEGFYLMKATEYDGNDDPS